MRILLMSMWMAYAFSAMAEGSLPHTDQGNPSVSDQQDRFDHEISLTAEAEPSTFVNNVNTIFGNFLLPTIGLVVPGPTPLPLCTVL